MDKLNDKEFRDHLEQKWLEKKCLMCHQANWNYQGIYELREFKDGVLVVGGPLLPVVPVVCNNCGNTILVNAIISKALIPQEKAHDTKEKETKNEADKKAE